MTYFTSLETQPGRNGLSTNPCDLLDFELVVLSDGESINGQTADREVLAVILGGTVTVTTGPATLAKKPKNRSAGAGKGISSTAQVMPRIVPTTMGLPSALRKAARRA